MSLSGTSYLIITSKSVRIAEVIATTLQLGIVRTAV